MFAECPNLVKVTFHDLITFLPSYTFQYCEALKEVYLPSTLTEIKSSCFYKTPNVELIKFTSTTPPILGSATTLKYACNAVLLAPYQYYNDYYTATNYLTHGNPIMGYGEFNLGDSLPSTITGYSIVWYPTLADAKNSTNATTTCTATGTMYAVLSAV